MLRFPEWYCSKGLFRKKYLKHYVMPCPANIDVCFVMFDMLEGRNFAFEYQIFRRLQGRHIY